MTVQDSSGDSITESFVLTVNNQGASHQGWSDVYAVGPSENIDGTNLSDLEVRIDWEQMAYLGTASAFTGYNVYRSDDSTSDITFDWNSALNSSSIATSSRSFTDTTLSNADAGKVFWYQVRPLIDGIPTGQGDDYRAIRVVVPPKNMVLIHRSIANRDTCDKIGRLGSISFSNYQNCDYIGPGNKITTDGKMDVSADYLVDRYEYGCPHLVSQCSTNGTGYRCQGITNAAATVDTSTDTFYDRATGVLLL